MEDSPNAPVFADRYRFEPVGNDWDRGRSGYTHLVYDLKLKRLGVIKRAETILKQPTHSLQNEIKALKALKGLGVPEVYDTSQAVYGSKNYDYAVIEYIYGIRVEKSLDSLDVVERAEIITQLFRLLSQAHQKGIINGDVDLKHLFWRRDKKQLIVLDWGNARLGVDQKKRTEFAYDLARTAEIIYSLVTRWGTPSAIGSIALPGASALVAGLGSLPIEFRNLCKWAPRTPSDGAQAPYTAKELFEVSKRWLEAIRSSKSYTPNPSNKFWLVGFSLLGIIAVMLLINPKFWKSLTTFVSPTLTFAETSSSSPPTDTPIFPEAASPTITPTETLILTVTPAETPLILIETPTPLPSPLEYPSSVVVFDDKVLAPEFKLCWKNEIDPQSELAKPEGFNRKNDGTWWVFNTWERRTAEESVKADFGTCPNDKVNGEVVDIPKLNKTVEAIALNTWITQIQPKKDTTSEGEFGLFLKGTNGTTREYMLWVDQSESLHLRIRENTKIIYDEPELVVSFSHNDMGYPQFRIQIFLEMDNNGSAIIYLFEADSNPVKAQELNPNQMIRIDAAVLPKMGDLQGFGLIGRNGSTEVLIWPLVLLGK
jgi:serine/threonine protein kinase